MEEIRQAAVAASFCLGDPACPAIVDAYELSGLVSVSTSVTDQDAARELCDIVVGLTSLPVYVLQSGTDVPATLANGQAGKEPPCAN